MKKAFTLVETVIVLFVIGLLSTILIKTYLQMSNISFRVEQEKNVTQELLFLSEVLQNLADRNTIDYETYEEYFHNNIGGLTENNGFVDKLFLSGIDGHISIYSVGDCIEPGVDYSSLQSLRESNDLPRCYIELEQKTSSGEIIKTTITNDKKAYLSKAIFKVIPFATSDTYFNEDEGELCDTNYLVCPHHPGFWLLMKGYSNNYGLNWSNNIMIPVQQFFNLQ